MDKWYRGTDNDSAEPLKVAGVNRMSTRAKLGCYFSSELSDAQKFGENIIVARLALFNPLRLTARRLDDFAHSSPAEALVKKWKGMGYDGLIVESVPENSMLEIKYQPEHAIVFANEQIEIVEFIEKGT